jgi:hypothetical protein
VSMGGFTLHATEAPLKDTSMIRSCAPRHSAR